MRLRSEIAAQGYSSTAMVRYSQQGRELRVRISREYLGKAPTTCTMMYLGERCDASPNKLERH